MPEYPGKWVSDALLAGDPGDPSLWMGGPVTRGELAALVDARQRLLESAGLRPGGTAALQLPPSLEYVTVLLAAWRLGAQVSLLDHRLVRREVDNALDRLAPQVVVTADSVASAPMAGYAQAVARAQARPSGRPAATPHVLIQLSSGSTGPSKMIARTAADLLAELGRYAQLDEYPRPGERTVVLASMVHVLGLVGGLLHGLHAGVELVFPDRLTADGIRAAVAPGSAPTTILGVPFHAELLATGSAHLPSLRRMIVAGELVRPWVPAKFTAAYGVPLGTMYGMTEVGVIATDLSGRTAPAVAPAPGMSLRVADGELLLRLPASPYIGLVDDTRWAGGWLRTRDAASIDDTTGLVTILGRLDSQISVGGLKVDLTEVEQTLCALPAVEAAVVTYDGTIEAYLALREGEQVSAVESALTEQLAPFKRPRRLHVLSALPRTATGKISRDRTVLRAAADAQPAGAS
ncbi:MAG: putative acyl-CoA synthetase [Actinomycetia bacterium]|nr:putative acyl-CoA synthetase [Actinomycetes bacterium]